MKLRKVMSLAAVAVLGTLMAGQTVMAATVSEITPDQEVQQEIVLEKEEEVVPTYTVGRSGNSNTFKRRAESVIFNEP